MKSLLPILILPLLLLAACTTQEPSEEPSTTVKEKRHFPIAIERGKITEESGKKWLWGGDSADTHFDITESVLIDSQYHFGIGREKFPALLEPQFTSIAAADSQFGDSSRFLVCSINADTRAYSIKDLTRHEVVNDVIGGQEVMAAYCILADLGAMYDRNLGGKPFTFALSGYTYHDPQVWEDMDGFVLWDRETESLWWPLIGKAVSGPMKGVSMQVMDESLWVQTTWEGVKRDYPDAQVLISGQDFDRPEEWPRYSAEELPELGGAGVAPRWGENGGE